MTSVTCFDRILRCPARNTFPDALGVLRLTLRELLDRYGPTAAVLTALALLIVLLPGNAKETTTVSTGQQAESTNGFDTGSTTDTVSVDGTSADAGAAGGGTSSSRTSSGGRTAAGTSAAAPSAGGQQGAAQAAAPQGGLFGSGPNCRQDKRQNGISTFMPPCANWQPGTDNGGGTSKGMTGDKVVFARFVAQSDPATDAALRAAGASDTPEDSRRMIESLRRYYNHHNETYGREVVIQEVAASGESDNDEAMKSDAIKIADEIKAFAAVNCPNVCAQELAARGVPCMCTVSLSSQYYQDNPPYIFSDLPTGEEYFTHIAEYMQKRLVGRPAKHAGTAALQVQNRVMGLIYYEGNGKADNYYQLSHKHFLNELEARNLSLGADVGYVYELSRAPDHAAQMIAKMIDGKVTTVIFAGDPLYPIFITQEATRQQYFPEWMITGTALTDTTFFGRTYDKAQWDNAFGMSPLPVFWVGVDGSPGYREYYHGSPSEPKGQQPPREGVAINVTRSPYNLFFRGVHMAGPNLTAENFSKGMFSYPRTGGTAANPLMFYTREFPTSYKDFTEVWWNSTGSGLDETSKQGAGTLMKSNQGARYERGKWPVGPPAVFGDDPSPIYTSDNPPGGRDPAHEQDGHTHPYDNQGCLSCKPKG